jgi:hypothetical protein
MGSTVEAERLIAKLVKGLVTEISEA